MERLWLDINLQFLQNHGTGLPKAKKEEQYLGELLMIYFHDPAKLIEEQRVPTTVKLEPQLKRFGLQEIIRKNCWNRADMECRDYGASSDDNDYISQDVCIRKESTKKLAELACPFDPMQASFPFLWDESTKIGRCNETLYEESLKAAQANCPQDCETVNYHLIEQVPQSDDIISDLHIVFERSQMPAMQLIYRPQVTWTQFFSGLGGIIGIWLAVSIYCLHEVLVPTRKLVKKVGKKFKSQESMNRSSSLIKREQCISIEPLPSLSSLYQGSLTPPIITRTPPPKLTLSQTRLRRVTHKNPLRQKCPRLSCDCSRYRF